MTNGCGNAEIADTFHVKECRRHAVFAVGLPANKTHAVGAHEAGNGRTDDFAAQELFKCAQDSVIIEGAALNDNVLAQLGRVFYFNNFIQRIFMTE